MRLTTRRRAIAAGAVAAFLAALAGLGALSRSSPGATATTAAPAGGGTVPLASWYWTMAVAPSSPDVLVLGTSAGLYRSADGGKTWQPTGPKDLNATSLVRDGGSLYAGGVPLGKIPSPVIRKGAGRAAPDGPAVLAASGDGGKTWRSLHPRGLPNAAVQALAVEPKTDALYALLNDGRLYRSTDGARSFALVSAKLGVPPWALALARGDRFVAGDMDTGSYVSPNARSWQRTPFRDSAGGRMVMEYAVEPGDPAHVLMTSRGIELSTDGGASWRPALRSNVMFGPVAWAAGASGPVYAVGFDRSLWRSDDGGASWTAIG